MDNIIFGITLIISGIASFLLLYFKIKNHKYFLLMTFIAMSLIGFGILTFLFGAEEINLIKEENKLISEVEKILDKEDGIILVKGESIYKIKVDKKIYDVFIEDGKNFDIKLITKNDNVIFEKK